MDITKYYNQNEIYDLVGIKPTSLKTTYLKKNVFKSLVVENKVGYVLKEEIDELVKEIYEYENMDGLYFDELIEELGVKRDTLYKYMYEGKFPNAIKTRILGSKWKIPMSDINEYKNRLLVRYDYESKVDKEKVYSIKELSDKFGLSNDVLAKKLYKLIKDTDIVKVGRVSYFPKEIIDKLNLCDILDCPPNDYDSLDKWLFYLPKFNNSNTLETIELYKEYYLIKAKNSNYKNINNYERRLIKNGILFINKLDKEVFEHTDNELLTYLSGDLTGAYLQIITGFLNFVQSSSKYNCKYVNKYSFTQKINAKKDKDIYSRKVIKEIYEYCKNIDNHIEKALSSKQYAESWFYVSMHFVNAWRSMDIIEFPKSNLIETFKLDRESLLNNKLSINESQEIINTIIERNLLSINKTNKYGALNKFLVNRSLVQTIATSVIILEYHYRDIDTDILLPLFKAKRSSKYIKEFLGDKFPQFKFDNRTFNRTVLTYFHSNVTRSSKNGDVAHLLARKMRGHLDEDTLDIYVMNMSQEEFFDDVSYHLFNRGHFGWLFNSLLEISITSKNKELSIDEKTLIIKKYQEFYSPSALENISTFLLQEQNNYNSLALEIASMDNKEIIERLNKVCNGYMPSKEIEGQCLYSKACKKPFGDCKTCPYLIPKIYLLNSVKADIEDIIRQLEQVEEHKVIDRIKLTTLLFKLMNLLNQSVVEFGKEYVSTFINIDTLKNKLTGINNKLLTSRKE